MSGQYRITVAPDGGMVLPVDVRSKLRVEAGGQLVIRDDGYCLVLEGTDDPVARAQSLVRRHVHGPSSVTDEFLAERRIAAACE